MTEVRVPGTGIRSPIYKFLGCRSPVPGLRIIPAFLIISALFVGCGGVIRTTVTAMPEGDRITRVNDSLFADVLGRAVQPDGAISYNELRSDSELTDYLGQLALIRTDVFTSRQAELAFWVNAHNAYVLDILRSNLPAHSVSEIAGFRNVKVALIGGTRYSLEDIEHGILAKQFREPRVFFALFDGTRSSPPLRKEPYVESHLSDQLNDQITGFLSDSTKNFIDRKANTIYLSHCFEDYSEAIEAVAGTMDAFLEAYAPPVMAAWITNHSSAKISYLSYDNTLYTSDIEASHEQPAQQLPRKQPGRRSSGGIK
jgi:hypothetical protein